MKIPSYYYQLKNLLKEIPLDSDRVDLDDSFGEDFNKLVDQLSGDILQNLDSYKINIVYKYSERNVRTAELRTKVASLIGFLEGEFDLAPQQISNHNPLVSVINTNTIAITITQTLPQLIQNATSEEEKEKLRELDAELNKQHKNWDRIKDILSWAINFSEKLFFQLLPIILKHYGYLS